MRNKDLIKAGFLHMHKVAEEQETSPSYNDFKNYILECSGDRRYKLFALASTTSYTSMIVKYRKTKYDIYYNQINKKIEIKEFSWIISKIMLE